MRAIMQRISVIAFLLFFVQAGEAASLRVSPTTLDLVAPNSATTLNLGNGPQRPINVQIRVFRWTQEDGLERLEPTTDVVASPPATVLQSNAVYLVRIVRVAKTPVIAEESYRVVIDEIPDPAHRQAGTVSLVVRHSIPVFFRNLDAKPAYVTWSLWQSGEKTLLIAHNDGDARLRLSDLSLSQDGLHLGGRDGLVGYVLGGATMQWPVSLARPLTNGAITLSVQTQTGLLDANVTVKNQDR